MKRIKLFPLILLIIILFVGCKQEATLDKDAVKIEKPVEQKEPQINQYKIAVELDTTNMTYSGKQTLAYVNTTGINLENIYFHLYPNAFETLKDAPVLFNTSQNMSAAEYEPGNIEIKKVVVDDKELKWEIEQKTILNVKLQESLKKNEKIEISLEYEVKIPTTEDRFGYYDKGINVGNWYPILCVYDETGWNLDPYYKIGDPFYSEVSDYDVTITVPKEMIVATSGNIQSENIDGSMKTYKIEGKQIRDFAWAASEDFIVKEKVVEGTLIKVYSIRDDKDLIDKSLEIGANAIGIFNRIFGRYPYEQYTIVLAKFPSGMEYPSIVLISDEYAEGALETVIVHETAHQWWYGVVGNDQVDEAWLDEGLATYSETLYMEEAYGEEKARDYYNRNVKMGYDYILQYLGENEVVNKPLSQFSGWDDYGLLVYIRGAMFIDRIKEDFGEEKLYQILKSYYETYQFKIAKTEDFIKICEDVTKTSFEPLVKEYLNGNQ